MIILYSKSMWLFMGSGFLVSHHRLSKPRHFYSLSPLGTMSDHNCGFFTRGGIYHFLLIPDTYCDAPNLEGHFFFHSVHEKYLGTVSMNGSSSSVQHSTLLTTGQVCRERSKLCRACSCTCPGLLCAHLALCHDRRPDLWVTIRTLCCNTTLGNPVAT